jgi:hypothetical protein
MTPIDGNSTRFRARYGWEKTSMSHWTQDLKRENEALRKALDWAMVALLDIPRSRLEKEQKFPHQDAECGLAYKTCAEESLHRGRERHSAILDFLAANGAL